MTHFFQTSFQAFSKLIFFFRDEISKKRDQDVFHIFIPVKPSTLGYSSHLFQRFRFFQLIFFGPICPDNTRNMRLFLSKEIDQESEISQKHIFLFVFSFLESSAVVNQAIRTHHYNLRYCSKIIWVISQKLFNFYWNLLIVCYLVFVSREKYEIYDQFFHISCFELDDLLTKFHGFGFHHFCRILQALQPYHSRTFLKTVPHLKVLGFHDLFWNPTRIILNICTFTFVVFPIFINLIEVSIIEFCIQGQRSLVKKFPMALELIINPVALIRQFPRLIVQWTISIHLIAFPISTI